MEIGKRIFYDTTSGSIIVNTGERSGNVIVTTPQDDIKVYKELADRVEGTYSWIDFTYGAHKEEESLGGIIVRIDLETKKPVFKYPDPSGNPPIETVENPFDMIRELQAKVDLQDAYLVELTMYLDSLIPKAE